MQAPHLVVKGVSGTEDDDGDRDPRLTDIFNDGEVTTETGTDERQTTNTTQNTLSNSSTTQSSSVSDRRKSELPQDQLENLQNEIKNKNVYFRDL